MLSVSLMKKPKHIFIVNPKSGNGKALDTAFLIDELLKDKFEYELIETKQPDHASEIASRYHKKDNVILYAVGGDGTAYEVLNGLARDVPMGLIPCGTGNDYMRMFVHKYKKIKDLIMATVEGDNVLVDYGVANKRRYLNCCCMGIDAEVVDHVNRISRKYPLPRKLVYMYSAIVKVLHPTRMNASMVIGDEKIDKKVILLTVMNGKYYGGGFKPAPIASIQDGKFDIVFVDDMKVIQMLGLLPKYFSGKYEGVPQIHTFFEKKVSLVCDRELLYCCDGEVYSDSKIDFEVVENGLTLRLPKGATILQ